MESSEKKKWACWNMFSTHILKTHLVYAFNQLEIGQDFISKK